MDNNKQPKTMSYSPTIRPSALPALSQCPKFTGSDSVGEAAHRGTRIDKLFRAIIQDDAKQQALDDYDEYQSAKWAAETLKNLWKGEKFSADEGDCHIEVPGMENGGTMDAICLSRDAFADIKSGQDRSYYLQMLAYAVGVMEARFIDSVDCTILYCDSETVKHYKFDYTTAKQKLESLIAEVIEDDAKPRLCDYCSWCANKETCSARSELGTGAVAELALNTSGKPLEAIKQEIFDNPSLAGEFLTKFKMLEELSGIAKESLVNSFEEGNKVEGWTLVKPRPSKAIPATELLEYADQIGYEPILLELGNISIKKANNLLSVCNMKVDECFAIEIPRSPHVRQSNKK